MNHLSENQLSALLDDALGAGERAACESHLAGCEACRAALSSLAALDTELGASLTHDPGEAYFATFAERVQARIAAGATAAAPEPATPAQVAGRPRATWGTSWRELFSIRQLSLAGGTLALLVTAGVALMRFQHHDDAARALREAAPQSALGSRLGEREAPGAAAYQAAPPAESRETRVQALRTPAAAPSRDDRLSPAPGAAQERRVREVRTLANGEPVPVQHATPGEPTARGAAEAGAPAPSANEAGGAPVAPVPVTAQMKQRSIAPAREEARKPESARSSTWGSTKSLYDSGPPAALAKDALRNTARMQAGAADSARSQSLLAAGEEGRALEIQSPSPLAVPCGTVRDARGAPVAGAQLTLLGRTARSSRSAADGTFCLQQPVAGDTLVILRVGFQPVRLVLASTTALAFALEPVGTLGSSAGLLLGGRSPGAPAGSFAPASDVYAAEPGAVKLAVNEARTLSASARRVRTAVAFERAAGRWNRIGTLASGKASLDARFQYLAMVREAYRIAPSPERGTRLRAALDAFAAAAPRDLPERATVLQWQAELGGATAH